MEAIVNLDYSKLSRLLSPFVDQATCLVCCKLYIAPETAGCGHTSCHACWKKRRSCISCAAPLDRRSLKLNIPIQDITEHVHTMCDLFEKVYGYRVETFSIGDGGNEKWMESQSDPTQHVNDWLTSSQNHFSAPVTSESTQEIATVEHLTSTVQVHSHTKKVTSPPKVLLKQPTQDDWEKIEHLPDTDEPIVKLRKIVDTSQEYSTEHPRRSFRKKEVNNEHVPKITDTSKDKCSSKDSSTETETKTSKAKPKWNNVKKMRKEFSRLNKQNRNKLNVSIEMCKKAKTNNAKQNKTEDNAAVAPISTQLVDIENDTPNDNNKKIPENEVDKQQIDQSKNNTVINNHNTSSSKGSQLNQTKSSSDEKQDERMSSANTKKDTQVEKEMIDKNRNAEHSNLNGKKETSSKMPFYKKGSFLIDTITEVKDNIQTVNYNIDCTNSTNADDIEITIKIGDTIANIFFKRKKNDPPKTNGNQEIQTSIGIHTLNEISHNNKEGIPVNKKNTQSAVIADVNKLTPPNNEPAPAAPGVSSKTVSTKKNTASVDTVTAQFEITDSVEKELSSIMEIGEQEACSKQNSKIIQTKSIKSSNQASSNTQPKQIEKEKLVAAKSIKSTNQTSPNTQPKQIEKENPAAVENIVGSDYNNDMDIFESGSVQEANVHLLKDLKNTPSEIFPTMKSVKMRTQNKAEKRIREATEDIEMTNKKQKVLQDSPKANEIVELDKSLQKEFAQDSEGINYDAIMGQVFANIDADIHSSQKSKALVKNTEVVDLENSIKHQQKTVELAPENTPGTPINIEDSVEDNTVAPEGYSENVFTVIDKENDSNDLTENGEQNPKPVQQPIESHLTPEVFPEDVVKLCTPHQNVEDDDKSVVEETPQKSISFTKPKNKSETAQPSLSLKQKSADSQSQSIVDISDSDSKAGGRQEAQQQAETPLSIARFVDHITHKSTPVARKSLAFDEDPEQTLCPSAAPGSQEREFLARALEAPPARGAARLRHYCLAGSCLSSAELAKVKQLCRQHNWKYLDKYADELTHLVVGVDDENRSQRSVKYMCALAASKWIVSFGWIDVCLNTNTIVNEEYFEALDGTGEPGPRRSRVAAAKLFAGITFYCMPPFSVLDVDTLKSMLTSAGGAVCAAVSGVRAGAAPALLLAEPENTQENKFIYMAVELGVVPVNYEWVLNCLGSYRLTSVHELLLCPPALLPAAARRWPPELVAQDD